MSNRSPEKCPKCGSPHGEGALQGLCPNCLMALNLNTETVAAEDTLAAQPPLPPEQIAPHFPQLEILSCLGRGGMGVVYKARQKSLNRFVALKLVAPERVNDSKFAERFTREAQALAALNHPNIVTIYDFGHAGGFYFLLMEFVDGANLRQLLQTRKFAPEEALAIVPPLCEALQFAHERGIVHRDIKPENLLLDKGGRVKVADFSIARMLKIEEISLPQSEPGDATQNAIGTPAYSAPEQKNDPQSVDNRADIYSLGVVFYELLTGELPGQRIEPPSQKVHLDVRLDEVVLRALEKKPGLRWQTAADFRTQLEIISKKTRTEVDSPTPQQISGGSRFQSVALTTGNILLAVAIVLLGGAAFESGIFFNFLYFFVIVMAAGMVGITGASAFTKSLALGIWQRPFAPEFRQQRWQIFNHWIFWLLAGLTLELCIVPAQFSRETFLAMHALYWGGIVLLMLLQLLPGKKVYPATNIAFAIGSIFILIQFTRIFRPIPASSGVTLASPVRGDWLVIHGGRSSLINNHFGYPDQANALDLERIVDGRETTGAPSKLKSYPSWGEPLYAPANGKVALMVNDVEDNSVGKMDPEHLAGNCISLDLGNDRFVLMAHLKKGSVLVTNGETVKIGQQLANCGNSGNTSQPHLHFQVQDQPDPFETGLGVKTFPIFFQHATRVRWGRLKNGGPFDVRRNDQLISEEPKPQPVEQRLIAQPPVVVETYPRSGETNVEPGQTEIRVRFSKAMSTNSLDFFNVLAGTAAAESTGLPDFAADGRTLMVKLNLQPGVVYGFWINSKDSTALKDLQGHPAVPYLLFFQTRSN